MVRKSRIVVAALAGVLLPALLGVPAAAKPRGLPMAHVEAAFAPHEDVGGFVTERIARARRTVQVQAYLFTDRRIAGALLAARRRGVAVEIVADAAQHRSGGLPHLRALHRAGASVFLDGSHAAAHNKVVIVDADGPEALVLTGSYNFTPSARERNAENVVAISGNRAVTDRFAGNFRRQRDRSTPWP